MYMYVCIDDFATTYAYQWMHTYMYVYAHTCMHAYIDTYIHTCVHLVQLVKRPSSHLASLQWLPWSWATAQNTHGSQTSAAFRRVGPLSDPATGLREVSSALPGRGFGVSSGARTPSMWLWPWLQKLNRFTRQWMYTFRVQGAQTWDMQYFYMGNRYIIILGIDFLFREPQRLLEVHLK